MNRRSFLSFLGVASAASKMPTPVKALSTQVQATPVALPKAPPIRVWTDCRSFCITVTRPMNSLTGDEFAIPVSMTQRNG
jgi:hypothetical protein